MKWSQSMKMNKIKQLLFCGLLALMAALCSSAMAQHIRGALEGTITDPNGAALSGARVIVKNNATNAEVATTANERGYFNVQNLEAGTYTVTVQLSGFNKYVAKDVNVKVGAVTPLAVTLQVGAQEQIVEVTATSTEAAVDTSRSTVDGVVTAKTIENLPLIWRNSNLACRCATGAISTRPRTRWSASPSADAWGVRRASRLTAWTSPTRTSAPPRRTFPTNRFRSSRSAVRRSIRART